MDTETYIKLELALAGAIRQLKERLESLEDALKSLYESAKKETEQSNTNT